MSDNCLPLNSDVLGYGDYDLVFLWNLLFMLGDSLNVLRSDEQISFYFESLKNRVIELCDFPCGSRNSDMRVVFLDVD